jgi:peptidoglycan/xylan/chitin deacetylase (PgdA/CDA1 family)
MNLTLVLKIGLYNVAKYLGLFSLAKFFNRSNLRILCYHGFETLDESHFRPGLFIRSSTLRNRMQYLRKHGYRLLPLQTAIELLAADRLPKNSVAVTIDDGFYSTLSVASPILVENEIPVTIYVTSYYSLKQAPVFRLLVQYIFWKTTIQHLDLTGLGFFSAEVINACNNEERERTMWRLIEFGEQKCDEHQRQELASELGRRAGVDLQGIHQKRSLSLLDPKEIETLDRTGFDIQLHTHRHRLPNNSSETKRELRQNRDYLRPLTRSSLTHFCYPSGVWTKDHWPWLIELGVETATTCDIGLNTKHTPMLSLRRFLDGENVRPIEFEAELSGFAELLRVVRNS